MLIAVPLWSIGTSLGIIAGNFLPARIVNALSVALYGMFLAVIIPPSKKNIVIMISILISFASSYACTILPYVKTLSGGTRTIVLTVVISSIIAIIKPIKSEDELSPEIADNSISEETKQ